MLKNIFIKACRKASLLAFCTKLSNLRSFEADLFIRFFIILAFIMKICLSLVVCCWYCITILAANIMNKFQITCSMSPVFIWDFCCTGYKFLFNIIWFYAIFFHFHTFLRFRSSIVLVYFKYHHQKVVYLWIVFFSSFFVKMKTILL